MRKIIAQLNGVNLFVESIDKNKKPSDFEIELFNKAFSSIERVLQKGLETEEEKWLLL